MKGFFCTWQNVLAFIYVVIHAKLYFRVEKYRPQTLNDLISHQDILSTSKYPGVSCCYPSRRTCIHFLVMLSLLSNDFEELDWALCGFKIESLGFFLPASDLNTGLKGIQPDSRAHSEWGNSQRLRVSLFLPNPQFKNLLVKTACHTCFSMVLRGQERHPPSSPVLNSCTKIRNSAPWSWR